MQKTFKLGRKVISVLLTLVMVLTLSPANVFAADSGYKAEKIASDYFYNQLNERAKAIYDELLDKFTGSKKADYYTGKEFIDLMGLKTKDTKTEVITKADVEAYINDGNKDIFNDFCAAKDALDLDHSELWYIDSGYLTFRVTEESGNYHVLIGPGRGETYLLAGGDIDGVKDKIEATDKAVDDIVKEALNTLNEAQKVADSEFTPQDQKAALITAVHDQIVKKIHYRYEIECHNSDNAKYIRTLYGIVTHEGVCEAYARTLQVCLTQLGIECVLIHGVQSKGTPEDHMWNAVNIPENDEDHWYVVDATWDDPLTANYDGTRDLKFNNGLDGKETNTYLMVGQSLVGEYWRPSGYVSTGNFEFTYPTIETAAYSGSTAFGDDNGLKVKYSAGGSQEDGVPAGVYTVTFKGWNAEKAAEHGFYFMLKMYDYHPDGTADVMGEWYYANATLIFSYQNPYFGDYEDGLRISSSTCEYVEIAVTSREPDHFKEWSRDPNTNYLTKYPDAGYFCGDESEIVAQSGMLYNVNSKYEAPPYVLTQTPAPNGNATAGYKYRFKVTYDDDLYHILPSDMDAQNGISTVASDNFKNDYQQAKSQPVQVRYTTNQQDLHNGGAVVTTQVSGELPFDENRDGIVDMEDSEYTDFKWIYKSDPVSEGGQGVVCPNLEHHTGKECNVEEGCPIVGVEFNFRASDQWIDDITEYNFCIDGVVGSRSSKFANNFSVIAMVPGLCPACYRSQGIDWNLWGQPTLLDAPENLNLHEMAKSGGTDEKTLAELDAEMNKSDINGRLMLVVENKSKGEGSRAEYEKIDGYLEKEKGIDESQVVGSSVFEINFNRICPMVKLKPNQGQSLRVQVGYPAGITYEDLVGDGDIEIKAYHFTRCAENDTEHPCPNAKKDGHKWGDDILGVDEITVIPTPYGMVIMCNSFSPFEIVAVKKTDTAAAAAETEQKTLVVVSDTNGVVEYSKDGKTVKAVGDDGNVKFKDGESKEFTVHPEAGYVVDTVSLGGTQIPVNGNKFTVDKVNENDVLNVTFIPQSVQEAEQEQELGKTVVASVCTHSKVVEVPDDEHQESTPATCMKDGYALATECATCHQTMSEAKVLPATGHTIDENDSTLFVKGTPATCTTNGTRAFVKCKTCGEILSNKQNIPALGHVYTKYEEGDKSCKGIELTAQCDRCDEATDVKVDPSRSIDHDFSISKGVTAATCTTNKTETFKCRWCDDIEIKEYPNTMTEHEYDSSGHCLKCDKFSCDGGHKNVVETKQVDATCTTDGHTAGKQCKDCGAWIVPEKTIQATGHDFGGAHKAGTRCKNCTQVMTSDNHTPEAIPNVPATCDKEGSQGGTRCKECGDIIEKPSVVPALGHDWDTENAKWNWSTEDGITASVTLTCKNDKDHVETFKATLDNGKVTENADCNKEGKTTYTATAVIPEGDKEVTIKATNSVTIPKTEHTYGAQPDRKTDATCTQHATETYKCTKCGFENTVIIEGEYADHVRTAPDTSKSVLAGCDKDGVEVSYCAICHKEISETIPAKGHNANKVEAKEATIHEDGNIAYWKCDDCGKLFKDAELKTEIKQADTVIPKIQVISGDVTGEGNVSITDAKWVLQNIVKKRNLDERQFAAGDMNKDSKITIVDAKMILRVVVSR